MSCYPSQKCRTSCITTRDIILIGGSVVLAEGTSEGAGRTVEESGMELGCPASLASVVLQNGVNLEAEGVVRQCAGGHGDIFRYWAIRACSSSETHPRISFSTNYEHLCLARIKIQFVYQDTGSEHPQAVWCKLEMRGRVGCQQTGDTTLQTTSVRCLIWMLNSMGDSMEPCRIRKSKSKAAAVPLH